VFHAYTADVRSCTEPVFLNVYASASAALTNCTDLSRKVGCLSSVYPHHTSDTALTVPLPASL
jgi:hypothetical protein